MFYYIGSNFQPFTSFFAPFHPSWHFEQNVNTFSELATLLEVPRNVLLLFMAFPQKALLPFWAKKAMSYSGLLKSISILFSSIFIHFHPIFIHFHPFSSIFIHFHPFSSHLTQDDTQDKMHHFSM